MGNRIATNINTKSIGYPPFRQKRRDQYLRQTFIELRPQMVFMVGHSSVNRHLVYYVDYRISISRRRPSTLFQRQDEGKNISRNNKGKIWHI
jgi:hypothetical protein